MEKVITRNEAKPSGESWDRELNFNPSWKKIIYKLTMSLMLLRSRLPWYKKPCISFASLEDRRRIYQIRHDVYASELGQHHAQANGALSDALDDANHYIVAKVDGEVAGFVSVTPPSANHFSIEKYISRDELPFKLNGTTYEVRLLTVTKAHRRQYLAAVLMYAAFRWIESHGGTRIIAMGRREILELYRRAGLKPLGREIKSGAVFFELLSARVDDLRKNMVRHADLLNALKENVKWTLNVSYRPPKGCFHGGAFWAAIGEGFESLQKRFQIINADVLDAWFDPAPAVVSALQQEAPWLLKTSPPTNCEGMIEAIARARGVNPECIVPGAGSSNLIFLAFRHWLNQSSHVLLLDPTYGEYKHVLKEIIHAHVDYFQLNQESGYRCDVNRLRAYLERPYDMVVLVNPNNPTGTHIPRKLLEPVLKNVSPKTKVWVDEAYINYLGQDETLEQVAAETPNIVVCKSMSKAYALSGVRAAYLCTAPSIAQELRFLSPPWAVSLPAQVAVVAALKESKYYDARYRETNLLRKHLMGDITRRTKAQVVASGANFILCSLPSGGPDATTVCRQCQSHGLFIRDLTSLSPTFGTHAIRIAVKDGDTNQKIVDILSNVLGSSE